METKFYKGDYISTIGTPYLIISASENENNFTAEKIIIFDGFNGQPNVLVDIIKYPKISGRSLDDFISSEIQVCKNAIFHEILVPNYQTELGIKNFNIKINLEKSDVSIINIFIEKFPIILINIREITINETLKHLIPIY